MELRWGISADSRDIAGAVRSVLTKLEDAAFHGKPVSEAAQRNLTSRADALLFLTHAIEAGLYGERLAVSGAGGGNCEQGHDAAAAACPCFWHARHAR